MVASPPALSGSVGRVVNNQSPSRSRSQAREIRSVDRSSPWKYEGIASDDSGCKPSPSYEYKPPVQTIHILPEGSIVHPCGLSTPTPPVTCAMFPPLAGSPT